MRAAIPLHFGSKTKIEKSVEFSDGEARGVGRVGDLQKLSVSFAEELQSSAVVPDRRLSQPLIIAAAFIFDCLAITASGVATYALSQSAAPDSLLFSALAIIATLGGALAVLQWRWTYTIAALANPWRQIANTGLAIFAAQMGLCAFCLLWSAADPEALRRWVSEWFVLAWAACGLGHTVFARVLAHWTRQGRLARRTVIVGGGAQALETIERLERSGAGALQILGLFDDRDGDREKDGAPAHLGRYRKLGRFDDLMEFCRRESVDLLIIAFPTTAETRILQILKKLWVLPIDVRISALGSKLKLRSRAYNYIGDVPFLPVFDKPMSDWNVAFKAIEDRVIAALALIVLSPVLAAIALGVKATSKGPALFRQMRHGFNNEEIGVYKFRSMYVDQCDVSGVRQVTRGDPRVTPFGAFLRRSSLDELPQLINVLRGELSLVGPRPHAMRSKAGGRVYEDVVDGYFARHKVKPGITGWAQVNGWRGETDTEEKIEQRVAHDLYYIENWSPLLDLRILAMTPFSLVTSKTAY